MLRAIFGPWHDFFSLVGTAAATLIGLMFVAASVGTGFFTEERQVGLRTLLSPTVVAFGVVRLIFSTSPQKATAAIISSPKRGISLNVWTRHQLDSGKFRLPQRSRYYDRRCHRRRHLEPQ
jgi:hypothetical protein